MHGADRGPSDQENESSASAPPSARQYGIDDIPRAHLAQSLAYRGYTPGVATAPTVVIPYSVRAVRRLKAAGIGSGGTSTAAATPALLPVTVAGVHALAHRINRPHGRRARAAA
ncbi:HXXEE domain-containing protein [Streptomyces sp. NPDC006510]|uniref:HXXEE domain-containing protein n=1 Tax=Streptomyces sp. NPDC006510 TaxID=3155600 RepID=UPI0033A79CD7